MGGSESIERHLVPDSPRWRKKPWEQFTTAFEGLTRQDTELQNELNQSRQQALNELAALRQEVRAASQGRKTRGETGALFEGYAGAAIPRLQLLMDDAAMAAAPTPNATIMDEHDRGVDSAG